MVDALDEGDQSTAVGLVNIFQELIKLTSNSVSFPLTICFTCRHSVNLNITNEAEICVEKKNGKDISRYIRARIPEEKPPLIDLMIGRASGIFQWVRLVVDKVEYWRRHGRPLKFIRDEILRTPAELAELYRNLLAFENEFEREETLNLFQWILFSQRPLTLAELHWATAIDFKLKSPKRTWQEYQDDGLVVDSEAEMVKNVKHLSRGLAQIRLVRDAAKQTQVETESDSSGSETSPRYGAKTDGSKGKSDEGPPPSRIVQFIHQSVNDFLLSDGLQLLIGNRWQSIDHIIGTAHYQLSRTCARYIDGIREHDGFHCQYDLEHVKHMKSRGAHYYPFLGYAVDEWLTHSLLSLEKGISQNDLIQYDEWPQQRDEEFGFICRASDYKKLFISGRDRFSTIRFESETNRYPPIIHLAAQHGITELLSIILKSLDEGNITSSVDEWDDEEDRQTPLLLATINHHEDCVAMLLANKKVNPNERLSDRSTMTISTKELLLYSPQSTPAIRRS